MERSRLNNLTNMKIILSISFVLSATAVFAQQQAKDSMPDYMKQFRMYKLPGIPDSAFNIQHWDSTKL